MKTSNLIFLEFKTTSINYWLENKPSKGPSFTTFQKKYNSRLDAQLLRKLHQKLIIQKWIHSKNEQKQQYW